MGTITEHNDEPPKLLPSWDFDHIKELVTLQQHGLLKERRVRAMLLVGMIVGKAAIYNGGATPVWSEATNSTSTKTLAGVCKQIDFTFAVETFPEGRPTQHFAFLVSRLCQFVLAEVM